MIAIIEEVSARACLDLQKHKRIVIIIVCQTFIGAYSGDLNSTLVRYSNGPKQFARRMVLYSSHDLNSELKVHYSSHGLNNEH